MDYSVIASRENIVACDCCANVRCLIVSRIGYADPDGELACKDGRTVTGWIGGLREKAILNPLVLRA